MLLVMFMLCSFVIGLFMFVFVRIVFMFVLIVMAGVLDWF